MKTINGAYTTLKCDYNCENSMTAPNFTFPGAFVEKGWNVQEKGQYIQHLCPDCKEMAFDNLRRMIVGKPKNT